MNPFDSIRTERPMVDPITSRRRRDVRELLLGPEADTADDTVQANDAGHVQPSTSAPTEWAAPDGEPPRRRWLLAAAAAGVVAMGIAGLVVTLREPAAAPVIDLPVPPSTGSIDTTGPPIDEPGDAAVPPATLPLPVWQTNNGTGAGPQVEGTDETAQSDGIPDDRPTFTPLVLGAPPDGYELFTASFTPGNGGFGIARYRNPETTTELHVLIRDNAAWTEQLAELGRATEDVGGFTVYEGGEGNGDCLPDVCQIDLQYDEHAGVSIMWTTLDTTELRPGSTRDALYPLVAMLTPNPSVWSANTTSDSPFPLPTSAERPLLVPYQSVDNLSAGTLHVGGVGSSTLQLRSPDGSMKSLWIVPSDSAPETSEARMFGDAAVRLLTDEDTAELPLYSIAGPCWQARLSDGNRWAAPAWNSEISALFDNLSADERGLHFDLPVGWSAIGASGPGLFHDVEFTVDWFGSDAAVSIRQAEGERAFSAVLPARSLFPNELFGGSWTSDESPAMFFWTSDGWSYVATSDRLASFDLADLATSMVAIDRTEWIERFGPLDDNDDVLRLAPGCDEPTLTAD